MRRALTLIALGLAAGFLAGLFGVGGGVVLVPAFVALLGMERRLAAGTSLAAIVPTALIGTASYAVGGHIDWLLAAILAVGSIVGAQIGALLLHRLPTAVIRWAFIGFLLLVALQLFFAIPARDAQLDYSVGFVAALVALGLVTGILAGLLGVGGGIIIVPVLVLAFGVSDLVAKGSSLAVIIPTALSGTVANWRRSYIDLPAAAIVGGSACLTTALGAGVAALLSPQLASWLFAGFILVLMVRMIADALRKRREGE